MTTAACKIIICTTKAHAATEAVLRTHRDIAKSEKMTRDVVHCLEKFEADMADILKDLTDGWKR